jgi:hypothetical protein
MMEYYLPKACTDVDKKSEDDDEKYKSIEPSRELEQVIHILDDCTSLLDYFSKSDQSIQTN